MRTVIATHDVADFDAVASQVAARLLYPGSEIIASPSVGRDVHPYVALHRDRFAGTLARDLDASSVERVIVVDVRRRSRLAHVGALWDRRDESPEAFELIIYDHHPAFPDDLVGDREYVEPVGSATTLIVEQLKEAGAALDRVEATLLALGLHADTGSLTFGSATSRDAVALAWLMQSGIDVSVLARYLQAPLDVARRHALSSLLEVTQMVPIHGLSVGFALIEVDKKLAGLDEITSRAHASLPGVALFAMYRTASGKLQIIGRSRSRAIDIGAVLSRLGGGGHVFSGAASVKAMEPEQARALLVSALQSLTSTGLTARDLMSSPVYTVSPGTPLKDLAGALEQRHHSGACVVSAGQLVGVVSRSDVARAKRAGQLHLAVKSFMRPQVVTSGPDEPLDQLLALMTRHDVGRVPILEGKRLLGIVTRTDVRRALYGDTAVPSPEESRSS